MKYPLKYECLPDRDGKYPSDEAWERFNKFMARMDLKYPNQQAVKKSA